ncbi:head GIN domain-containing protein [Chryseobacterium gotjawalense]|uniref:Head GIN domain-containing protein n=1 Tax=Chryseobacterium gotjawalense TaxID=3042315 RepID=A0ABY8R9F3_9FLAO|nr:head GIN domain-containing protein [Chryseobacterium sp. wdc7]WHF50299.1 head GIN domain-containing protein [Chryseobacterium sp. wdc7]
MKKIAVGLMMLMMQYSFAQVTRNVGEFSSLKVYDKINVVIIPSNENKVEAESADVETVNKNGELKIRMAPARILQGNQVSVKVYYQTLNDLQASQGSSISSTETLKSRMLSLTSNEGSRINLGIDTGKLNVKINSGGEIKVSGKADHQDIVVNSGGKFSGENVESQSATVAANAGGIAEVFAGESVNATTRAGGIIDVYGDPDDRKFKNVIGGKITFK